MRSFLIISFSILFFSCTTGDECGPFGPVKEGLVKDTLTVAIPNGIDSILIKGAYQQTPTFEIIRVPPGDSIRFEADIATSTIHSSPVKTELVGEVQTDYKRLWLHADRRFTVVRETLRSQVECSPMPDQMVIKHVKIYMPGGVDIRVVSY